jgi:hypothetical protein
MDVSTFAIRKNWMKMDLAKGVLEGKSSMECIDPVVKEQKN